MEFGDMENMLQVGAHCFTHMVCAVRSRVFPTTDDAARFKTLKEVILDTGKEQKVMKIQGVKFFKQFVIPKFEGLDRIEDVEIYRQKPLFANQRACCEIKRKQVFYR